jgi:Lon protease-like protein
MEKYLSLFPLDVVLFPEMVLPLHIFEERYKEMIGECILSKAPFGILYAHDESVEKVGCTAEVTQVLKKYPDGRMDILTVGRERFEIIYFDSDKSYLRGVIEPYGDSDSAPSPAEEDVRQVAKLYQEIYRLLNKSEAEEIELRSPYESLSFRIAGALNISNALKQQILLERSEKNRLDTLLQYFTDLIPRLHQLEQAAKRAGLNGNLRKD